MSHDTSLTAHTILPRPIDKLPPIYQDLIFKRNPTAAARFLSHTDRKFHIYSRDAD